MTVNNKDLSTPLVAQYLYYIILQNVTIIYLYKKPELISDNLEQSFEFIEIKIYFVNHGDGSAGGSHVPLQKCPV